VARKYGSFPIVLETYRECLQDVFDLPALRGILRGLADAEIDLVEVETPSASPMAASLLFDYVATYMYEDDTPAAERRAQALSLDRELLRELLGQEELRGPDRPRARSPRSRARCCRSRGTPTSCTTSSAELAICRRRAGPRVRRDARPRAARFPGARRGRRWRRSPPSDAGLYRDASGSDAARRPSPRRSSSPSRTP
jgi:ATP-dependent Lhr-like helicase